MVISLSVYYTKTTVNSTEQPADQTKVTTLQRLYYHHYLEEVYEYIARSFGRYNICEYITYQHTSKFEWRTLTKMGDIICLHDGKTSQIDFQTCEKRCLDSLQFVGLNT